MTLDVHQLTNDPTAAWREISKSQRVLKITMKPPHPEVPKNKVRVVCMSDTHSLTPHIKFDIPDGELHLYKDFPEYLMVFKACFLHVRRYFHSCW